MTSGNGVERSGEEPASGSTDGVVCDDTEAEDITVESVLPASLDRPRERRRKVGVQYRPV
jgi:hypothetical protein